MAFPCYGSAMTTSTVVACLSEEGESQCKQAYYCRTSAAATAAAGPLKQLALPTFQCWLLCPLLLLLLDYYYDNYFYTEASITSTAEAAERLYRNYTFCAKGLFFSSLSPSTSRVFFFPSND